MPALQTDIGAHLAARANGAVFATAAGTGDATEVDGTFLDRTGFLTCVAIITWEATLADTETLSIAANLQDASDGAGAGAADYGPAFANAIVGTGLTGGTTERGVVVLEINLIADAVPAGDIRVCDQFVRIQFTPDLSASGTDTAVISGTIVFAGADTLPAV